MKVFLKRNPFWLVAFLVIVVASVYWTFVATDRYVSRSHIVLQTPELVPSGLNIGSLLSGTAGSGDLLLLKDHLESVQLLRLLQDELSLREHYADRRIDRLSRLSRTDVPMEAFHAYMSNRIKITFDDYSSLLRVEVQAYTPEMAQAIVTSLLREGERHMNRMGQRLAEEQLGFIDAQVQDLEQRVYDARDALLAYQNEQGLVAPTQTVEAIFATVSRLEAELAVLNAQIRAQSTFQSPGSPEIRRLKAQAASLAEQIEIEKQKMAGEGVDALNRISAEFASLQMRAEFATELYSNALMTLESTRVEAARKLKQVSVLEAPTLPEYATRPKRIYNIVVVTIFSLVFAAILQMLTTIIRDHRD